MSRLSWTKARSSSKRWPGSTTVPRRPNWRRSGAMRSASPRSEERRVGSDWSSDVCSSDLVTAELDEGPIIEQEVARVDHRSSPAELAAIGRDAERVALARAVRWHAEHRILLHGRRTVIFR